MSANNNVRATACGQGLNVAQRVNIANAIDKLRLDQKLTNVYFWGKIQGKERDYFIAQAVVVDTKIQKIRFVSTDGGLTFAQMPELDEFILETAPKFSGRFTGNPSLKLKLKKPIVEGEDGYYEDEEDEEYYDELADEQKVPERRLTELERLAYVVDKIETDCCVVPKGAYYITATGNIQKNIAFTGLAYTDLPKLHNYALFRPPQHERTLAKIHKAGVANLTDFLDSLDDVEPRGSWSLQSTEAGQKAVIRSLSWPGYEFSIEANNGLVYTAAYFGSGEPNTDLLFML